MLILNLDEVNTRFVAGFDLAGRLQKDGSFVSNREGIRLPAIPDEITYRDTTYTLEEIQKGEDDPEKGQWINAIYV